jgi:outer membrane lipoprotein carrier protein
MDSEKFWCLRALNKRSLSNCYLKMKAKLHLLWLSIVWLCVLPCSWAQTSPDAIESLSQFLKLTQSGRAQFSQVVVGPAKADQAPRRKTSSGTFEFQRPQQFRFAYQKPFVQTMVSDGQWLWLFDADLNQVTVRKQNQLLGQTPAAFISSSGDLKTLQAEFNLKAEPDSEGLQWVRATPKQSDGAVQVIRVGLKLGVNSPNGASQIPMLSVLEIVDGLGQTSRLTFQNFEINLKLSSETFQFKAPAGVQVIRP